MSEQIILNNRYRIEERQGTGGMAMVYRARDLTLERMVAIKILRKDFTHKPEFRQRFRQEAKSAANLSHPNIVTIHDFGIYEEQLYIVMEYVPGTDIKSLLKERGRLNISEALDLMIQACAGIGYAHRAGLVHCDVKPQNMLVTPDNRLKVVDFGIARALSTISPEERSQVVWGSPQYFAPEQASGIAPSPATDVYSLGVVLFEMLTGRLPFTASMPQELARLHREAPPPSPRSYNPAIPIQLEQIVLKVLSKEPSARYRAADQLGRVLSNLRSSEHVPSPAAQPGAAAPAHHPVSPSPAAIATQTGQTPPARPATPSSIKPPVTTTPPPERQVRIIERQQPVDYSGTPAPYVIRHKRRTSPDIDVVTWLLALLALIAVGGLVPFWMWVLLKLNSPF